MNQTPDKLLRTISRALSAEKAVGYLFGDLLKYEINYQTHHLKYNVIDIVVSFEGNFNTFSFYENLSSEITINSEVLNTENKYHIISDGYILRFELIKGFNPKHYPAVAKVAKFTVDSVFKNIHTQEIIDFSGDGVGSLRSDSVEIKSIIPTSQWDISDYLGFAIKVGEFEKTHISQSQLIELKSKSLRTAKETETTNINELLKSILLSYEPGSSIKFLSETFTDGKEWTFIKLVELMSEINTPINEESSIDSIFSEKRINLVNVYNQFYLFDKKRAETPKERTSRLMTTMRLMFDTPTLNIEIPYIDTVSVLTASVAENDEKSFKTLEDDPFCPYGICPECIPENCDPACCCCSQVNFVRDAKTRCHKKVLISCAVDSNGDVTGYDIPPYDPDDPTGEFLPGTEGVLACETILGIRSDDPRENPVYCENWESIGASEGWWTIPYANWPCTCTCASELEGVAGDCELTCVTCNDYYCQSEVDVSGHDCFYNISLTPGEDCCGPADVNEIVFVVHAKQPATNGGSPTNSVNIKQLTTSIASRINGVNNGVKYALVTFDDTHPNSDAYGSRYVFEFTSFSGFVANIPNTIVTGDLQTTPYPSPWHAAVRAITETSWSQNSRRKIIIVTGYDNYGQDLSSLPPACSNLDDLFGLGRCFNTYVQLLQQFEIGWGLASWNTGESLDRRQIDVLFDELGPSQCIDYYTWSLQNGGASFLTSTAFLNCVEPGFASSSCKCMDYTPIPIVRNLAECHCDEGDNDCLSSLPQHCYDIPIPFCTANQECSCDLPFDLYVCGNTIVIDPSQEESSMVCCSDLNGYYGLGCECFTGGCEGQVQCCGPQCYNLCEEFPNEQFPWGTEAGRRAIIDSIWLDCWDKKSAIDQQLSPNCTEACCPDGAELGDRNFPCSRLRDPNDPACQGDSAAFCEELLNDRVCCDCGDLDDCCNCCLLFADENCELNTRYCFNDIRVQTLSYIANNCIPGGGGEGGDGGDGGNPPPDWEPPSLKCLKDRCIVGEPKIDPSNRNSIDEQCDNASEGCASVRHPAVVVLNNGVGLVSYESLSSGISEIKIQQFKTSVPQKILPNREFDFGRLEHQSKWYIRDGETFESARLYYYGEIPQHLISGSTAPDPSNPDSWGDVIVFRNGPLEKKFFPLTPEPLGNDAVGNYIRFYVTDDIILSNAFPSSDDVYDIKFFILDSEDALDNNRGFIGDSEDSTTDGSLFIFSDRRQVDSELLNLEHFHNGKKVPLAFPSLATAYNYSDGVENSHWVYLAYQAFEEDKWNVYLRQIRLSEYDKDRQIEEAVSGGSVISLQDLGINEVILRVFCVSDNCSDFGSSQYLLTRTIVFEMILDDGREVLNNPDLPGNWQSLCSGYPDGDFDKSKVFVKFVHSVVADRCPDQFGFDDIFYNWQTGDRFISPASSLSATSLFELISLQNDSAVELGSFDPAITVGGARIQNSSISVSYYQDSNDTTWSVISNPSYDVLSRFEGMDIGEPIPLTLDDQGHSTRPVVKVNYNNDVFVAYETTATGLPQIKIKGTNVPSTSLPIGIFSAKNLDATVNSFYSPLDFVYAKTITSSGLNQQPDIFVDLNDVIHLTWQSNRDNRWEIYYATSDADFYEKRITNSPGRSLSPSIHGDDNGRLYIVWHDDRYGDGFDIAMAYYSGTRILPLAQQDPYLAAIRNSGYVHYMDEITLLISNETNFTKCYNDIIVDFYLDRTLQQKQFSVALSEYPFAFNVPDALNDNTTQEYVSFGDWSTTAIGGGDILESSEYDSSLIGSEISRVTVDFDIATGGDTVSIAFKASDIPNDPLAGWTQYAELTDSQITYYSTLGLDEVKGRYKSIRLKRLYSGAAPTINSVNVVSELTHRLCLSPNSSTTAILDLTPEIRVTSTGTSEAEFPIPIGFARNNTYFVGIRAIDDEGNEIDMPDQYSSASCETCSRDASTWNLSSCSVKVIIPNETSNQKTFNFRYTIYHDLELQYKIAEFVAFYGSSDLDLFTVDGISGNDAWESNGLVIDGNLSKEIIFWPSLSPNLGLLCGVKYYIKIEMCSSLASSNEGCLSVDLEQYKTVSWSCNCQSVRWDSRFEDAPINIREVVRWKSSGDGGSDTRITETVGSNNLNAKIILRSNLNGVIIYESNRREVGDEAFDPNLYKMYSSIFSIIPRSGMYSSGSQNINTGFDSIVFRSDIPICPNNSDFECDSTQLCDSCYEDNVRKQSTEFLIGNNVSFDIDQFDNLFMAVESPFRSDIECNEFSKNSQKYITVHTCGANSLDLFKTLDEKTQIEEQCELADILRKHDPTFLGTIYKSVVLKIRVKNNHVKYHITKDNVSMPVVDHCVIDLDVIAIPETKAIRFRNSGEDWSIWHPFHPQSGDNRMEFSSWKLTSGSGIKIVQFEAATQTGISQIGSIYVVADYARVNYSVKFFRPTENTPKPEEGQNISTLVGESAVWDDSNILNTIDGIPVAALRPPVADEYGKIIIPETDYLFVEIEPSSVFSESLMALPEASRSATFDFINQGNDIFNAPTILVEKEGRLLFRGVIQISRDNNITSKDGLAYIVPHFSNDCSDFVTNVVSDVSGFEKDVLNQLSSGSNATNLPSPDVFDRDEFGRIKYQITVRPEEDPYLVFGDPNYRLNSND